MLEERSPKYLLSSLTAGLITGIIGIIRGISYAALIFSGSLAPYFNIGVGQAIFSTAAISIVVALTSSLPGMIATPLAAPTIVLAILAGEVSQDLMGQVPESHIILTVVAAIALGSLITGVFLWLLGRFRLSYLVQFVPYPVVGGFMAGTGYLLIDGAIEVMTGEKVTPASLPGLLETQQLTHWGAGLAMALVLLVTTRRFRHFLVLPGCLLGFTALVYGTMAVNGVSIADAQAQNWLLGPFPDGQLWHPLRVQDLKNIEWTAIANHAQTIGLLVFTSLMSLTLTNNGLELALEKEINLNQELQSVGLANILAGCGSSMAGNQALPSTLLVHEMNANYRLSGVFKTLPCLTVLLLGPSFLSYFPKSILGSLMLFLGLTLLLQWLYQAWFKLSAQDYFIILATMATISTIGFLEGIITGCLLAVFFFLYNYSQVNIIKAVDCGPSRPGSDPSNPLESREAGPAKDPVGTPVTVQKSAGQAAIALTGAEPDSLNPTLATIPTPEDRNMVILQLQGYLCFVMDQQLMDQVGGYIRQTAALASNPAESSPKSGPTAGREEVTQPSPQQPHCLILDFEYVSGVDASVVIALKKIMALAHHHHFRVLLTALTPQIQDTLLHNQVIDAEHLDSQVFETLSKGTDWVRTQLALSPLPSVLNPGGREDLPLSSGTSPQTFIPVPTRFA